MSETNALSQLWNNNQKPFTYGLIALAVLVGAYFFYTTYYLEGRNQEAVGKIAQAQQMFSQDSFNLALTNPGGGFPGFVKIASDYSGTKTANTAKLYAGLSYLNLGQFDSAIKFLEDHKASGQMFPILKMGALGDCYAEKNDLVMALDYYTKAADAGTNETLQAFNLQKAGMLAEKQGKKELALVAYNRIKKDFPMSAQGRDIDKYIIRAGGTLN